MKDITHRLDAYIESRALDFGDSNCETVLDQLYQAYLLLSMIVVVLIPTTSRQWDSWPVPSARVTPLK